MAQEDNLGRQPRLRLERRSQCMQQQAKERSPILPGLSDLSVHYRVDRVFGSDNGWIRFQWSQIVPREAALLSRSQIDGMNVRRYVVFGVHKDLEPSAFLKAFF